MSTTTIQTTPTIRGASNEDLAAIKRLLIENHLPTDGVQEVIADFFVAVADSEIVGVVGMEYCNDYGLLRSTAVATSWRSKGLGRQLVERIVARAESRGVHALYLLTTTAEQYFPSFGFHPIAREAVPADIRETVEFKSACPASATVMCRESVARS